MSSESGPRYETIAELGTGGMATVFLGRAYGARSDDLVALKRAHAHVKRDRKAAESMLREANLAARVRHPNVVNVLDVDHEDGDLVIVLDYIQGCTLRTLVTRLERAGEWRPREMLRIVLDVAAGLHAAHGMGLIHRDVSPSNVLVGSDGVARLADFGLAKAQLEEGSYTATGILKGKPAYMAPEYVLHQRVDAASDLFSLAVVAWEALAGARLFKGRSDIETLSLVAEGKTAPLSSARRELRMFDAVFARALAPAPEDRFASVEDFAREVNDLGHGQQMIAAREEVAALVEELAAAELAEQRRLARADAETITGELPTTDDSDDVPTEKNTARRRSTAITRVAPPQRATPPPPAFASVPPPGPMRTRRKTKWSADAAREAAREHKLLIGALFVLIVALVWMWSAMAREQAS